MKAFPVFNDLARAIVQRLLATQVVQMAGRKLEEGDWTDIYCVALGIPKSGWSNLNIDVVHDTWGVEHKLRRVSSGSDIAANCGTTLMHPAATRSIRVPPLGTSPNDAMRDILTQYGGVIDARRRYVRKVSGLAPEAPVDLRVGWMLWQDSLRQFLYFEEPIVLPDPDLYEASWNTKESGLTRKGSTNLWIYEKGTGIKRYSVTTEAGAKIQPYFDIPPVNDPGVYIWTVIGEFVDGGTTRAWVTEATRALLRDSLGSLDVDTVSNEVLRASADTSVKYSAIMEYMNSQVVGVPVDIRTNAYQALRSTFKGPNDDVSFRALLVHIKQL